MRDVGASRIESFPPRKLEHGYRSRSSPFCLPQRGAGRVTELRPKGVSRHEWATGPTKHFCPFVGVTVRSGGVCLDAHCRALFHLLRSVRENGE